MDMQNCVQHMMKVGLEEPVATALCRLITGASPGDGPLPNTVDGGIEADVTKPPKLERCVQHLMDQGHSKESAFAICNATLEAVAEGEEQRAAPMIVTAIENSGPDRKFIRKGYVAMDTKALKNGDIEAYVSTEAVDRVGDVIKAKGWMLDNFKRTGAPVLFSHDYSQPPIGKAVEMEIQRKGLWSVTRFHEKTQMSRDLAKLARDGDMKAWSVGFNPLEDPEMRKDEKGNFAGYTFNKSELLEYSLVAVGANPEAVSKAVKLANRGIISHQMAAIIAGPSPVAEEGIAEMLDGKAKAAMQSKDLSQAKIIANHLIRRALDARR
jgi:HK97 family phage prohead protease